MDSPTHKGTVCRLHLNAGVAVLAIILWAVSPGYAEQTAEQIDEPVTPDYVMPKYDPNSPLAAARAKEAGSDDVVKIDANAIQGQPTPVSELPSAPGNGEMTFVFSDFTTPVYPGWDNCPNGWSYTNKEQLLATLPNAEQARLLRPENEKELTEKWKLDSAPGDRAMNVCTNYNEFPERALQFPVEGKIAFGLDLDDDNPDDSYVCKHKTFVSPLGDTGIDNQTYRAKGCNRSYRGPSGGGGETVPGGTGLLTSGQFTIVIIMRDVDSLVEDDSVEIVLAASDEQPIVDQQQNILDRVSFNVSENLNHRNELRGRISNGVLVTEPADIFLEKAFGIGIADWDLERARLRLAFRPDGSLEGLLGGYERPFELIRAQVTGGRGTAHVAGIDCASEWNTLMYYADGARDPETGQCTRISNAYRVKAVPAFVFDRRPESADAAETN